MSLLVQPEVAAALTALRQAFEFRPQPIAAEYCPCCHDKAEMDAILRSDPEDLTEEPLRKIVWDAYWTWGNWPSLAFYVPRLLELCAENAFRDGDILRHKLYIAAHPNARKAFSGDPLGYLDEAMRPHEQQAIFRFCGAMLTAQMCDRDSPCYRGDLREWFDFLAIFGAPVQPLLEQWSRSDDPYCRGRFGVVLADLALTLDGRFQVDTTHLNRLQYLPENREAVAQFITPGYVAAYLSDHADDMALAATDEKDYVDLAFDWAARELAAKPA